MKDRNRKILDGLVKVEKAEINKLEEKFGIEKLKKVEDRLLQESTDIIQKALAFGDIELDEKGNVTVPPEWHRLPEEEKEKRIRIAKYALLPTGEAPFGLKMSLNIASAIIKSRNNEKVVSNTLNIEKAYFPSPAPLNKDKDAIDTEFEVIDVEE